MLCIPGIARGRPWQIPRRSADCEFMRGQFAEKHRASLGQGLCNGGIGLRDVIGKRPRMRRGSDSLGFDDVLKRDWNAVERPAPITCRYGPFGGVNPSPLSQAVNSASLSLGLAGRLSSIVAQPGPAITTVWRSACR